MPSLSTRNPLLQLQETFSSFTTVKKVYIANNLNLQVLVFRDQQDRMFTIKGNPIGYYEVYYQQKLVFYSYDKHEIVDFIII